MTAIIIPRKHLAQPQGRVELRPEWMQDAAVCAYRGTDLVSGSVLASVGAAQSVGVVGSGHSFAASGQAGFQVPVSSGVYGSEVTVIAALDGNTVSRRQHIYIQGEEVASAYTQASFGVGMDYGGGDLGGALAYVEYNNDYLARAHSAGAISAGPCFVGMTKRAGAIRLFNGGTLLTNTASSVVDQNLPTVAGIWVGGGATGNRGLSSTLCYCFVSRRALSDVIVRDLTREPWQLFRADPIRIYSLPSGAITLGTPRFLRVTSSGFGVELDLS